MRDNKEKYQKFTRRAFITGSLKAVAMSCIIGRFYYLQILNSTKYKTLSDINRLRVFLIPAKRGVILDTNKQEIAGNKIINSLFIKREYKKNAKYIIKKINNLNLDININETFVMEELKNSTNALSLKLIENISNKNARILESQPDIEEIEITKRHVRYYPFDCLMFHILGYVAIDNASDSKYKNLPRYYNLYSGKYAIEKKFNDILEGKPGIERVEVDAKGKFRRKFEFLPAISGNDVQLSIDHNVQAIIQKHIQKNVGAIGVVDLLNNKVLGLLSNPGVDPNIFIEGITSSNWKKIHEDPTKPMLNRCISSTYSPGSIFKIIMFLAILEANINPDEEIFCPGYYKIGNKIYQCWKKHGHGNVNLNNAFLQSCNVYFFHRSLEIGYQKIVEIAKILGLNNKTNIELNAEKQGILPTKTWKINVKKQNWYFGDTLNMAIGQGYMNFTAVQLLQMITRVISQKDNDLSLLKIRKENFSKIKINKHHLKLLKSSMLNVFDDEKGTGYNYRILEPNCKIGGKSGTSQVISLTHKSSDQQYKDHSLFVGFLNKDNIDRFAIATVIENGGWGSKTALPISKNILFDIRNF